VTGNISASAASRFRPDLEGIRAVAVLLVVLFHAGVPGFEGGYIGVDVFYVLSGFFITGLLIREIESSNRLSFRNFYSRRFKRLVPAATLVIVTTLVAGFFIIPPLTRASFGWDGLAAAWDVSNIRFAFQATDYLTSAEAPSPFLHFWSLAVETQFYLVWPALLAGVAWLCIRRSRSVRGGVTWALGTLTVLSLASSVWLTTVTQPMAFFMLPTRAWELAVGGLLVLVPASVRLPNVVKQLLFGLGILVIVVVGMVYNKHTPFPGWAAVLPVVATGLVIFAGATTGLARVVVNPVGGALGRWSYSLYLWHWPILVLTAIALSRNLPVWFNLALMLLATVMAAGTFRFLENLIRERRWSVTRSFLTMGALTLTSSLLALAVVLAPFAQGGGGKVPVLDPANLATDLRAATLARAVPANLTPTLTQARKGLPLVYSNGCHQSIDSSGMPACVFGDPKGNRTVWLVGDSHAAQWFPAVNQLAKAHHWKLVSHTYSGCPTSTTVLPHPNTAGARYVKCAQWQTDLLAAMTQAQPDLVIDSGASILLRGDENGFAARLADLRRVAGAVIVLGDGPRQAQDVPPCVSDHMNDAAACMTNRVAATRDNRAANMAGAARQARVNYVDTVDWLCAPSLCPVIVQNILVYRDDAHLTPAVVTWLAPVLDQYLETTLK